MKTVAAARKCAAKCCNASAVVAKPRFGHHSAGRSNFSGQPIIGATHAMSLLVFVGEGGRKLGLLLKYNFLDNMG